MKFCASGIFSFQEIVFLVPLFVLFSCLFFFTKICVTIPGIEQIHLQYYDAGDKFLIDVNDMDEEHFTDEICVMKKPYDKNRVTGHCPFVKSDTIFWRKFFMDLFPFCLFLIHSATCQSVWDVRSLVYNIKKRQNF
jgi:hypothetical protein